MRSAIAWNLHGARVQPAGRGCRAARARMRSSFDRGGIFERHGPARRGMMISALAGTLAFQKGLGAVHAPRHPFGAIGAEPASRHAERLADACGAAVPPAGDRGKAERSGRHHARRARRRRLAARPAPGNRRRAAHAGVTEEMMHSVSVEALRDRCHRTNPREATQEDYLAILHEAAWRATGRRPAAPLRGAVERSRLCGIREGSSRPIRSDP